MLSFYIGQSAAIHRSSFQPFGPELMAEGLMTEGLMAEGFQVSSISTRKYKIHL
jgi:hypothetical protein